MKIILLFGISLLLLACVKPHQIGSNVQNASESVSPINGASDAKKDLEKGICQFKTMGMPMEPDFYIPRDSAAKYFGLSFAPSTGCEVTDSLIRYQESYNTAVKKHLAEKFGQDWELFFQAKAARIKEEKELEAFHQDAKYLDNNGMALAVYFKEGSADLDARAIRSLEQAAKALFAIKKSGYQERAILLNPFKTEKESAELIEQRLFNIKNDLIKLGIRAEIIVEDYSTTLPVPSCANCPFPLDDFQYKVGLKIMGR